MPRRVYAKDHPIPGEVWKATPCGMASVSDFGRCQTVGGVLLVPHWSPSGTFLQWQIQGQHRRTYAAAKLVAHLFLGATPGKGGRVTFRNGDASDIRASNLCVPWSETEDAVIREATSVKDAACKIGRLAKTVRTRARFLGVTYALTPGPTQCPVPLADRLTHVTRAVEVLEQAGVGDERINLALRIDNRSVRGFRRMKDGDGQRVCITALFRAGWSPEEIASAFGWRTGVEVARRKMRGYGLIPSTGRSGTILGPVDHREDETWLQHETGYWVSDLGRVAGPLGLLRIRTSPRNYPWVSLRAMGGIGRNTSRSVCQMMLDAFRPGLQYSAGLLANGDPSDIRLANIRVPIDEAAAHMALGRLVPGNWDASDRAVAIQAGLLALLEGRALDVETAAQIGRSEQSALISRGKISLDELDPYGRSRHETFSRDDP